MANRSNYYPRTSRLQSWEVQKYQNKAKDVEKELITFEEKKEKIGKIETQRYEEIAKILTNEQLEQYNSYINSKKQDFNEKIDRIKKLEDNVNLTNQQKAKVLKFLSIVLNRNS